MASVGGFVCVSLLLLITTSVTLLCAVELEDTELLAAYTNHPYADDDAEAPAAESSHHHHHHHHHKTPSPSKSPVGSPPPERKLVAVQGVVYCKPCKFRGVDTLTGTSPLPGAVVKLQCNNTRNPITEQATTDKHGYFFFMPSQLTTSGSHKCKVSLVSSPLAACAVPTALHGGATGAALIPAAASDKTKKMPFQLFTVGPFAFEPAKGSPCH